MAGRKELFCASSSPVTLSALINACCTETILQLFSLRSSCCPSDAAHAASSGQQLLLREKSFRIVSASSRRYMAGWKSYWTTISTEKLHLNTAFSKLWISLCEHCESQLSLRIEVGLHLQSLNIKKECSDGCAWLFDGNLNPFKEVEAKTQ